MNRRTFVAGLGTATLGGSALLASGSYSRVESQRAVTIETVGDEDAYLRLVYQDSEIEDCERQITLVELTNQFKEPLDDIEVDFETTNENITFEELDAPEELGVGEAAVVTLDASCTSDEPVTTTVTFTIEAEGEETSVTVQDRTIEVTCECPPEVLPGKEISFIAFCGDDPVTVEEVTVTHVNEDGEPTGVEWKTEDPVEEVVLWGGREWYLCDKSGATSGNALKSDPPCEFQDDPPPGPPSANFGDGKGERTPSRPCGCAASTKLDAENGDFDPGNQETTESNC